MLEKFFKLAENGTTVRTEALAGMTTFLTMAYIIFVPPAVLSGRMFGFDTGMEFGAIATATCLSAALATPRWKRGALRFGSWRGAWLLVLGA